MDGERDMCPIGGDSNPLTWGFDGAALASFLRARHPLPGTAKAVARETGAPIKTVQKWMEGATPSLGWFLALLGAYGPALLAEVCARPPAWVVDAARQQRRAAVQTKIAALQAELARG